MFHPISQFSALFTKTFPIHVEIVFCPEEKLFNYVCSLNIYPQEPLLQVQCCIPFTASRESVELWKLAWCRIIIGISHAGMRFRKIEKTLPCFWVERSNQRFETQFNFAAFKSQLSEFSCKFRQLSYAFSTLPEHWHSFPLRHRLSLTNSITSL